jgi:hypothetical protein
MSKSDQEIAEGEARIRAMYALAYHPCSDQPVVLGLYETIFGLLVRDELL